ncbi:AraC family transcriptional regulator [Acidisoma silvae]|uniref:Helix-turn-helix transcriptional regulator n=1 Tax=Acidisoma silvae TaxID=2802396 RepID=A0A963YTA8_9PROT|nr:AraC family transcriptional regulator [Acidisoma silvae]MCB8875963.1 helix-turn-helix transcriptional regulator [Acidisoma silvae]
MTFSRFQNLESRPGYSNPPEREEAFTFCVSLKTARYSWVTMPGKSQSVLQSPGEAYLFDLTSNHRVSLDATFDTVRIHIPQTAIDQMAHEKGIRRIGGFHSKYFGPDDQILYRLAHTILPAIENSSEVTTAFVEYIGLATFDHIAYTYGGIQKGSRLSGGLSPSQLRRACDFIEANLAGDPSIVALAGECGLSMSYFARAFRVTTGMTPHQWIIQRRVARAKSLIQNSKMTLVEIALICGFVDQSHLGRHFLRVAGRTPAQWRREHI